MEFSGSSFILGILATLFVLAWIQKILQFIKRKLGGNNWYQVIGFCKDLSREGYWFVDYKFGNHIVRGYVKKEPPRDINVKDLRVRVKHTNLKNGMHHLFWEKASKIK